MPHSGKLRTLLVAAVAAILAIPAAAQTVFGISASAQRPEDPYIYVALRALKFMQYNSRWVDSFDDPQAQVFATDPGPYARIFVKYRSSSAAANFFRAGATYTWRAPTTRSPDHHLQGHYGHYVVEGAVAPESIQAMGNVCWYDLTRTEIETQNLAGQYPLTYLRGSAFIFGPVDWNFAWESNTPEHVAQWRWRSASAPDNLMDLQLRKLTATDIREKITSRTLEAMAKADRHQIDVAAFMTQYGAFINGAAIQYRLNPELVAAILITEQRDQKDEIGVFVRNWYLGTWSAETAKKLGGYLGWIVNIDASIGLGQIRPRTVQSYNLGNAGSLTTPRITSKLEDPQFNISASAQYARIIADAGARYAKRDFMGILNASQDKLYLASLRLGDFASHSLDWTPGHIILLGSEYTSTMWDGKYKLYWGLSVLRSYHDVLALNVCR